MHPPVARRTWVAPHISCRAPVFVRPSTTNPLSFDIDIFLADLSRPRDYRCSCVRRSISRLYLTLAPGEHHPPTFVNGKMDGQYPEFERDLQRKDLESEGRDYLRANRGNLAQAGVEFARNNPDLARKVSGEKNSWKIGRCSYGVVMKGLAEGGGGT